MGDDKNKIDRQAHDKKNDEGTEAQGGLTWKRRVPLFDSPTDHIDSSGSTSGTRGETVGLEKRKGIISRDAEDMLILAKRKQLTMTQLYKHLGLSGYKGNKSKMELIRAGFADEVALPANRRGRRKKLLQVTPRGTEYLKSIGITDSRRGRGNVRHLFYQQKIKEWYESHGYTAEIEARIADDSFDVLAIARDGKMIGIEVACSSQYEEINARKALKTGVDSVLFVCETTDLLVKIRKKVEPLTRNGYCTRYGYKLVNDYLEDE